MQSGDQSGTPPDIVAVVLDCGLFIPIGKEARAWTDERRQKTHVEIVGAFREFAEATLG